MTNSGISYRHISRHASAFHSGLFVALLLILGFADRCMAQPDKTNSKKDTAEFPASQNPVFKEGNEELLLRLPDENDTMRRSRRLMLRPALRDARQLLRRRRMEGNAFSDSLLHPNYPEHLGKALTYRTIFSEDSTKARKMEFLRFHKYLQQTFPKVHAILERKIINDYSLVYIWRGSAPKQRKPVLLLAHQDVVPVDSTSLKEWTYPPFSGVVTDSFIWGRGSIDVKVSVIGILESIEALLSTGFQPQRDIYLAFGHDEEVYGTGASAISKYLESEGLRFEFVLDEGGTIMDGLIPDIAKPIAMINIAEKGYLTLELTVKSEGGHSSVPTNEGVVGILGRAIYRLQDNQFDTRLTTPVKQMFRAFSKEMHGLKRFVAGNPSFFARFVKNELASDPLTHSLIRTTIAPTIIQAGLKDNVLPTSARLVVNFRILPGETIEDVIKHVRKVVRDDRVVITALADASNPPKVSSISSRSYRLLKRTIETVYPDVLVAPGLNPSTSDSRFYVNLTENILRFVPNRMKPGDPARFHGINERIEIGVYKKAIEFYYQLLLGMDPR